MSYSRAEVEFVLAHTAEIDRAAAELDLTRASAVADTAALRRRFGEYGRAAAELAGVRRRMPGWIADEESRQQATHPAVAAERARVLRAAGAARIWDVTCSVGGEGRAIVAAGLDYTGGDTDLTRLLMARRNVPAGRFVCSDALRPAVRAGRGTVVVADPARRSGGRRITDPARLLPPLPDLLDAHPGREMAVKCAPGIDYSDWPGKVTVTSVDGAVKEACLYTPGFGTGREAVVIRSTGAPGHRPETTHPAASACSVDRIDSSFPDDICVAAPGRFIIDPDGAVVRAGLVAHWGAREGLWMLDPRIAHLSGDHIPAGTSGFPFIEQVPLKKLRAALSAHGAGSVEILVRGVDVDPDRLRRRLRLRGKRPMAVVVTRVGRSATALVCGPRERAA